MPRFVKVLVENLSTGAKYNVTRFQRGGIAFVRAKVDDVIRIYAEADVKVGALWFAGDISKVFRNTKSASVTFRIKKPRTEVIVCIGPTPPGPFAKPMYAYVDIVFKARIPHIPKIETTIPKGWEVKVGDTISFDVKVYDEQTGKPLPGTATASLYDTVTVKKTERLSNGRATFKFTVTKPGVYSIRVVASTPYGKAEAVYDRILTVEGPAVSGAPNPVIVRDESYLVWNGSRHEPGEYVIKGGTIVTFRIQVRNEGGEGDCYVWLYDFKNRKPVFERMFHAVPGGVYTFNGWFKVVNDMVLKMQTWRWAGRWVLVDEYG